MMKLSTFRSAAILCGGVLVLSGCQHQATVSNGVPMPAPHAAPPVQTQMQDISSNPHIPPSEKARLESHVAGGNGIIVDKTPPGH